MVNLLRSDPALPSPLAVIALWFATMLLQIPVGFFMQRGNFWSGIFLGQIVAVATPTLLFLHYGRYRRDAIIPLPALHPMTIVTIALGTMVITMMSESAAHLTQRWLHAAPLFEDEFLETIRVHSFAEALYKIPLLALIPACVEELLFRGVCQTSFVAAYGVRWGLVLTSALFALSHANLWYAHLYFALGVYLGVLRQRGRSLWWPVIAHSVNNAWTLYLKSAL